MGIVPYHDEDGNCNKDANACIKKQLSGNFLTAVVFFGKSNEKNVDIPYLIGYNISRQREMLNFMTRTFVELPFFQKKWKAMGLDDKDLKRLQEELIADPKVGAAMQGTGGIRKMRFAFEKRGKSGSVRVIYVDFEVYEKIFLITAYPKNEKENLTQAERAELKQMIHILEQQLKENDERQE